MANLRAIGLLLLLLLGQSPSVMAQATADADAEAKRAAQTQHRAAVRAFARAEYPRAIELFNLADHARPSAAFSFNIAKAYDALHDDAHALASYRDYLRRDPSAQDARQVQARIAELAHRLAKRGAQQVTILSAPAGASAAIDREPRGPTPITLELAPGQHDLRLQLAGYQSAAAQFELAAEQPLDVGFTLLPDAPQSVVVATREPEPERSPSLPTAARPGPAAPESAVDAPVTHSARAAPSSTAPPKAATKSSASLLPLAGFATLGASVAAFGGALTFELLRASAEHSASQQHEQVRFAQELDTMRARQTAARVLAGTGGALAAVGGLMLLIAGYSREQPPSRNLALACMPSTCSATLTGAF